MEPDVLRRREGIQLSYSLPHRLNDAYIYPRKPTNGSDVIICAHDQGLRILWYAGKKLKPKPQPNINGNSIDLTDDDDNPLAEYEEDEEEVDPERPYHNVLTHVDIALGTAATKVAVPPLSTEGTDEYHQMLNTHAIVLAACADSSLRLIAIPLEPGTDRTGQVQQVTINGTNSHPDLISDVAITITPVVLEEDDTRTGRTKSLSRRRASDEGKVPTQHIKDWSFLLASTSATGTGLLLVHQVPINSDGQLSDLPEDLVPLQRRFLRCSLARCSINFNPSLYPSRRHSNLLIASMDGAAAKVYQALYQTSPGRKRRGSTATVDSIASTSVTRRNITNDKVVVNLLPPFSHLEEQDLTPARKRVLDAKWILHGCAVLALLDDGEWGIWDVEAAGPSTTTSASNLVKGQSNIAGIQGGAITRFAVKGRLNIGSTTKISTSDGNKPTTVSSLAPMTPHTRKTRSNGFFKGQQQTAETSMMHNSQPKHGNLAVLVQPSSIVGSRTQDESVIFSYESTNVLVSSIQSYWRSENSGQGSFEGSASAKPLVLPRLQTAGEQQGNMCLMPHASERTTNGLFATPVYQQNFMVVTSSRLIFFVAPLAETAVQPQTSSLPMRLLTETSSNQDQMLLDSGELDVDGMDRILDGMAGSGTLSGSRSNLPLNGLNRKSVGFQLSDDDGDIDMGTPTTSKGSRSKLTVKNGSGQQDSARRLFT